jgi:hypothetical protein
MIFKVASLGMGVQSVAMVYMIRDGVIPKPDLAVFADTGIERPETMELVKEVVAPLLEELGIEFRTVTSHLGRLDDYYRDHSALPLIGTRHCTVKFKVRPIRRLIREYVGPGGGKPLAEAWLGITTDEDHRESKSDVLWCVNRFPLLERGISRQDCLDLLELNGVKVVKSGCTMCPYQSGVEWLKMRTEHPDHWARALAMEEAYFTARPHRWKGLRYDGKRLTDPLGEFAATKCDAGACFI